MAPTTRRTALLALVLAVSLLLAGCTTAINGDDDGTDTELDDADIDESDLQAAAVEAMEDVETATVAHEMTMSLDGEQLFDLSSNGVVDYEAQEMELMTVMDDPMMGEQEIPQYVIGDTMYMEFEGDWVKENVSSENFWENEELTQQQEVLEEADLDIQGEKETDDGHEVYVVNMSVDEETMESIVEDEFGEQEPAMPGEEIEFGEISVTQHIDTESSHIRFAEMEFEITAAGQTVTMEMTVETSDINEPVDIELPEEAEDATTQPANPF